MNAPTPREVTVLILASQGLSNREIAEQLGIKPNSVKNIWTFMFDKYNWYNRTQASADAVRQGWID